ncbi:acyltransferase family protein [Chthonobacter albigriseus]|uniref:acyltransferase family protein n=1 Tax=Chthonobacter albigriseus TaxID=1683161 RepID=UPI0015EF6041|nr:acyltransferase [Chthonobacter albigriseus]
MDVPTPTILPTAAVVPAPSAARRDIVGVQYLRGLAALMVVITHAAGMIAFPKYFGVSPGKFFEMGWVGVDLFFVISGFIISYATFDSRTYTARLGFVDFMIKRFIRIIPFMWVCILVYLGLRVLGRGAPEDLLPYWRAILLWPVGEVKPDQIWTLRHEFLFYIVFGLTMLMAVRRTWILVLWCASPLVYVPLRDLGYVGFYEARLLDFFCNPANVEFGLGLIFGNLLLRNGSIPVLPGRLQLPVLVGLSSLLMVATYVLGLEIGVLRDVLVLGCMSALILFVGLGVTRCANPIERLAHVLGDASYAVYLIHPAIISILLTVWAKVLPDTNVYVVLAGVTVLATAGGVIMHFLVEKPLIAFLNAHFAPRAASARTA